MNAVHPCRTELTRCAGPGFSLTGGHSHTVSTTGGDVLRPTIGSPWSASPRGPSSGSAASRAHRTFGLRTRNCECWPPRQWIVRTTSARSASSTSAMMSVTMARRSRWPRLRHGHAWRIPCSIVRQGDSRLSKRNILRHPYYSLFLLPFHMRVFTLADRCLCRA